MKYKTSKTGRLPTESTATKLQKAGIALFISVCAFLITTRIDAYSTKPWVNQLFGLSLAVMLTSFVYAFVKLLSTSKKLEQFFIIAFFTLSPGLNPYSKHIAVRGALDQHKYESKKGPLLNKMLTIAMLVFVLLLGTIIGILGYSASEEYLSIIVITILVVFFVFAVASKIRTKK